MSFGEDAGENFISSGRIYVEVLGSAVCMMSDKVAYYTSISDSAVGG